MFVEIGEYIYIELFLYVNFGVKFVYFGDYIYVNYNLMMVDDIVVYVGDWIMFGFNVILVIGIYLVVLELWVKEM